MKPKFENSLQVGTDWKRLLESAQSLSQKKSLKEQSNTLCALVREIFNVAAEFWYAHPSYPLPGDDFANIVNPESKLPPLVLQSYTQRIPQYAINSEISDTPDDHSGVSMAGMPVIFGNNLLGILVIKPISPSNVIPAASITGLANFLMICAMPMEIYRLSVLKSWRVGQLEIVRKVSDRIASITDLDNLCEQITEVIRERFGYYYVAIYICEKGSELSCRSSASLSPSVQKDHGVAIKSGEGIIGWVADHMEELVVEDVCQNRIFQHHKSLPETVSEAAIPLMIGSRLLGVLDVQSEKTQVFHEMDLLVLRTMADNISIAIEGARLFSGLHRKSEQIATVFDISHALSSILDFDTLMDEVVKTIQQRNQYLQVNVYTVHTGRGKIIFRTGTGDRKQEYIDAYLTFDIQDKRGILPWVARERKTFLSNDVIREPLYRSPEFMNSTARSEISVPLLAGGEIVGILDIQSDQENAFDANDVFFFEALSAGIATAIRNATLFRSEQFRRQVAESVRDVAGILSNGSSLEELINRILEKLQESLPCDATAVWLTPKDDIKQGKGLQLAAINTGIPFRLSHLQYANNENGKWIKNALDSDEPVIRTQTDPRGILGEALNMPANYSAIAAPLRAGGDTVGLITLIHHQPDRYGTEARLITQTFAGYAAAAIQNNQLFGSIREKAWISEVLLRVAEVSRQTQSLDDLLDKTVDLIPELIGCSSSAAYFLNKPLNVFERKAACGFQPNAQPPRNIPGNQPVFLNSSKQQTPVKAYFGRGDFSLIPQSDHQAGIILPLVNQEQFLGIIWAGSCDNNRPISDENLKVLTGISNQTATAVKNILLLEDQKQDAYIATSLLRVAQTIASKNDLHSILDSVLNLLPSLAEIETAVFFVKNTDQPGFKPVTAQIGLPEKVSRSLETHIFPGDIRMLDMVTDQDSLLLAPLNSQQRSGLQWSSIRHVLSAKDAIQQKPQEGGWLVGIPLHGNGSVFGALMILEKPLSGFQLEKKLELLDGISRQAAMAIQNDRLQREILDNEKLQQEFHLAGNIQHTFLPGNLPEIKGWDISNLWEPASQVGGDFYDFYAPQPGYFYAVIADVSDKGMPAALYMAVTRTLIRSFAQEGLSPGLILKKVNDFLMQDNPAGMFVTVAIIAGDSETGVVEYANAGHNPPLLRDTNLSMKELPKGQIALGVLADQRYQDHTFEILPDSYLILYTDGITDTLSPSGEDYALKGLIRLVTSDRFKRASLLTSALENDLIKFRAGLSYVDDITALILHRL